MSFFRILIVDENCSRCTKLIQRSKNIISKFLKKMTQTHRTSQNLSKQLTNKKSDSWANQNFFDELSWYSPKSSRSEAEKQLAGAPVGTFLIRLSAANSNYVLSIVASSSVYHCLIRQTQHGCFGFAEPYNIFKSLQMLIAHYSVNSLELHNRLLQTTLKFPYHSYVQTNSQSAKSDLKSSS